MKHLLFFVTIVLAFSSCAQKKDLAESNLSSKVDIAGFLSLSSEVESYRKNRLINIETFNKFAEDSKTIILDTRSKSAFDQVHIKNAVHINFSDFTDEKLAKIIPDMNTRILIYCNNNLRSERAALMDKRVELALNIPTFINLYGYGYKNIYELNDYLEEDNHNIHLVTNEQVDFVNVDRK